MLSESRERFRRRGSLVLRFCVWFSRLPPSLCLVRIWFKFKKVSMSLERLSLPFVFRSPPDHPLPTLSPLLRPSLHGQIFVSLIPSAHCASCVQAQAFGPAGTSPGIGGRGRDKRLSLHSAGCSCRPCRAAAFTSASACYSSRSVTQHPGHRDGVSLPGYFAGCLSSG